MSGPRSTAVWTSSGSRLRFPAPVPVGSRIRTSSVISEVTEIKGGVQVQVQTTFEVEGGTKPAVVAQMLLRYYA